MGIWDKIKGEFVDIIEWTDSSTDTMVYRFERHNNEIKYGAKLTVRESQVAVLVDEGQFADVFEPGMYTLETANMPILSTLKGWKHGFNSPFKSEVYFVNTKRFNDLKWGTKNPIMMRDADFGMVRVRAFGTYAMRVANAQTFLKEIVGTNWKFTTDEISEQLRNYLVSGFAEAVAAANMPVLDLYSHYDDMGDNLGKLMGGKFTSLGVELLDLMIENVSVPPEVEQAIDTRSKMGAVGNLDNFMKFQAADAMVKGAENPGGAGGLGAQIAAGQIMGQMLQPGHSTPPAAIPPPMPAQNVYHVAINGQQHGPFTISEMQSKISTGEIKKETLIWTNGMAEWKAAELVADIASLFGQTPPPVPPQ